MCDVGMNNKQFGGFLRFLIGSLQKVADKLPEQSEAKADLLDIIAKLQATLED